MLLKNELKEIKSISFTQEPVVRLLPQLLRADYDFAYSQNNSTLNEILEAIPKHPEFKYTVIDTKVHMLMKGMYPCIPGWHADDFYRPTIEGAYVDEYRTPGHIIGQPDLINVLTKAPSLHYMLLLGDSSCTEFLLDDIELDIPTENVYLNLDAQINNITGLVSTYLKPQTLYSFGPQTMHRGVKASKNGWRFFIRVTYSNTREAINEIRHQSQVYVDKVVGW